MAHEEPGKRHLRVDRFHRTTAYKSKNRGSSASVPRRRDFVSHGQRIGSQIQAVQSSYAALSQSWEGNEAVKAKGICIELESAVGTEIDTDRLEQNGWQLLNLRHGGTGSRIIQLQTWFVPDGKLAVLAALVSDYLTKTIKVRGGTIQRKYRPLIDAIERVGAAAARQLWTEIDQDFPEGEAIWFEIWLRRGQSESDRQTITEQFQQLAEQEGIRVGKGQIILPEHTILAAHCSGEALSRNLALLNCIAEIRRGRDYADIFVGMRPVEQVEWARDLLNQVLPLDPTAPYVSVLDTGINRGHPLLETHIPEEDNSTINDAWSSADDDNHGTLMAGLCLYGDLTAIVGNRHEVSMPINVEGVKILPPPNQRRDDEKLAGAYTAQGVALAEGKAPTRKRVWCITTTMKEPNNPIPTSWSAQMDSLACGLDNGGSVRRVLCLSAGNIPQDHWHEYPLSNYDYSVENPAQSWNALCVGAFTELQMVRDEQAYRALALRGTLAPVSSTSLPWDGGWPNKPDVVFEGGNAGFQDANQSTLNLPELMLLSTHAEYNEGAFGVTAGTSPATALAARMVARLMSEHRNLQPETIRGLVVHSADWTDGMRESISTKLRNDKRLRSNFLLRTVGYGSPNLRRALESAKNRATMIAECEIQPFKRKDDEVYFNEMHIHALPWPITELRAHPAENVRMRVTLSYFIEPNPGNRGYTSNFRYSNCGLRFKVSSPGQTEEDLCAEVSKIASDEFKRDNRTHTSGTSDGWILGKSCFRGSVHSDIWEGSAADLISMGHLVVYPVTGWWRTRLSHDRSDATLKYSLIVTLESENSELDIYTEIENAIAISIGAGT